MKIERIENELILRDAPGGLWIFGLFFAIIGAIFVFGSLGGFTNYDEVPRYAIYLSFLMGATGIGVGVWQISAHPLSKIIINPQIKIVRRTERGLFKNRDETYHFEEIAQFIAIEDEDDESNPIWKLAMLLKDGETIELTKVWSHDAEKYPETAQSLNQFARKPQIYTPERRRI
jgi:hypothetical protein